MPSAKQKITGAVVGITSILGTVGAINPNCILSDVNLSDHRGKVCMSQDEYASKKNESLRQYRLNPTFRLNANNLADLNAVLKKESDDGNIDNDEFIKGNVKFIN